MGFLLFFQLQQGLAELGAAAVGADGAAFLVDEAVSALGGADYGAVGFCHLVGKAKAYAVEIPDPGAYRYLVRKAGWADVFALKLCGCSWRGG